MLHNYSYQELFWNFSFQVALGQMNDLLAANYNADQLPKGKHSVKGLGAIGPDPAKTKTL